MLQLVESIKLVMGYTAADRIIISGMSDEHLAKSTQRVSQTVMWRSAIVRVTRLESDKLSNRNSNRHSAGGNNRQIRHLLFQDDSAKVKVSIA